MDSGKYYSLTWKANGLEFELSKISNKMQKFGANGVIPARVYMRDFAGTRFKTTFRRFKSHRRKFINTVKLKCFSMYFNTKNKL